METAAKCRKWRKIGSFRQDAHAAGGASTVAKINATLRSRDCKTNRSIGGRKALPPEQPEEGCKLLWEIDEHDDSR